ncbi:hypothetical protein F6R98_21210 [Candidatus Methylospira mobilis]|uniref:Uncharacterized protein n=1 Tax=Candidatus Methylospira mobilis TaxID=1808979 RepID=A0A5Q0BMK5_9GAMM|nr:UvrD-helicase domain-containing protein [Candidatus Methylospira mobilis]QFY44839.1 hypothetical protein F6R98_21210 [Candidatus Methylospira mobilis]WNV05615.1 AAA family ATPase [Candidatus Methylospira mobilis]
MRVLEYIGLNKSIAKAAYKKVKAAIERDDFRSAEVKKLTSLSHGKFYRARLDASNRLLFSIVRHGDTVYALMLEVIANHAYDKSRFLRGAAVDEALIPNVDAREAANDAEEVRYIHPERGDIHLLDKVISFDDVQEAIYCLPPPLIVVGGAGSGKTALTLEKMKHAEGEVLYVTHSAYLAQSARDLYYANGFEHPGQEAIFLSYREFVETIRVPTGREAGWRDFSSWFSRQRAGFKGVDAHQAFEEIRGVIAADAVGVLSLEQYRELGVRQSIFPLDQRDALYGLFEKYRVWLQETKLYDLNLIAHEWRQEAQPRYDFVVVDEVQDLTTAQLALILAQLKKPGHFLLCGDSNQIVHPNFFSWSKVKSLFWNDPDLAAHQELKVLRANFRNGGEAIRVSNALLKVKHRRFGSIDRESNFLVEAVSGDLGAVTTLADKDNVKRELNEKTKASTQFAVLVMRDEDKAEARRFFQTPLIFSIHEAKGLEYENIVLYRFVSANRAEYLEIAEGVTARDLEVEELDYRRARDKSDKSLEVYKFFVNALYVALTRAIKRIYLIESDARHPLLQLLGIQAGADKMQVEAKTSTLEDWQKEARKLELQGKQEQADAIRKNILKQVPVPWPVFDEARLREHLGKVFHEQAPSAKYRHQLFEYAAMYSESVLVAYLGRYGKYEQAKHYAQQFPSLRRKHLGRYEQNNFKEVLRECERHGVDYRSPMNFTPLMAAAATGNIPLIEALLERGANIELTDHLGRNALHWAMVRVFQHKDKQFAQQSFATIYGLIAPPAVDVMAGERLVRIDRHLSEYFLFQTMWALFKFCFSRGRWGEPPAFDTKALLAAYELAPLSVLPEHRRKRPYLSGVLSRNEVERDYAYNRRLFQRVRTGWYQFNPALSVRVKNGEEEAWTPVYAALNLPLVKEFSEPMYWRFVDRLLRPDIYEPTGNPVSAELYLAEHGGNPYE